MFASRRSSSFSSVFLLLFLFLLLAFAVSSSLALMCYKDVKGVYARDADEPVDTTRFQKKNCSHNGTGNIEKVGEGRGIFSQSSACTRFRNCFGFVVLQP